MHKITQILVSALCGDLLSQFPVHERLQWTVNRKTKRKEDKAYGLLGIFGIFMPLITAREIIRLIGFTRQNISLTSWTSFLRSGLTHLLSGSARVKLPDHNSSFTDLMGSKPHALADREGVRINDLESDGGERKAAKAPRMGDMQICLIHDVLVTQDQLNDARFRPTVVGPHR